MNKDMHENFPSEKSFEVINETDRKHNLKQSALKPFFLFPRKIVFEPFYFSIRIECNIYLPS